MITIRSLFRNKTRTFLTITGAAIGIAIFVSLTSASKGFKSQIQGVIDSYRIDIIVQSNGASSPFGSRIMLSDYSRLSTIEGIDEIYSMVASSIKSHWNPYLLVIGLSSSEMFANRVGILKGRMLKNNSKEIVIGERMAALKGYDVNDKVALSNQAVFTITGIYTSGSSILDGAVILDLTDAQRLLKRDDSVNMAFIRLKNGIDPENTAKKINNIFPHLYATRSGDFIGQLRLVRVTDTSATIISLIALIASCVVIMNTLLMTISERTKEIGILMAIGWSRVMIMKMVIIESIFICFAGGIMGNLAGFILLWLINYINPEGLGWWVSVSSHLNIFLKSMGIALLMGIISSLYPVFVATRLMPAEALRYE